MTNVLEVEDLYVNYGKVEALKGLSLTVGEAETVSLLGNNGAGKSTTVSTISGVVRAVSGRISAFGEDITHAKAWDLVERGIVQVPEGRRIFSRLTVHENLQVGGYTVRDTKAIDRRIAEVYELLPRLAERRNQQGGTLSGGEQQMLAIGRAMIADPKILMLDEPSMGLAPLMVAQVMDVVRAINARGTAVLLIEQNARSALKVAKRGYVLDSGVVSIQGSAEELSQDPRVVEAYLGK
ncbi:ABC transporter ATP-binding protein [Intrasporangium calvum]|uniref:Amino acid/amide ABC transporter ATP-binding protein 2, HAAT family n=1 Tax=Intrasporangium calvum (strain ATCC 23552 / DSM 43043 / JCM 3097 / NBRC 12989 / NCIMB 10167 / NRRL B-3866 / 7 KIP) TaxID=710696 RepID=E6SD41_INTC7|nr:ABC transporter ATP-binding protein [Intrasporangium calvum]ADU49659.1 amino acid/amide ABC transporter ATP-binding protein 2, HAAT family [Intrasporangium calvum DSM 43043]